MPRALVEWARKRAGSEVAGAARAKRATKIVAMIQKEAAAAGATLAHGGKGGLDPSLALKVFRRDDWTCQVPNCETAKEDLDLDHIGGHPLEIADDPDADAFVKRAAKMKHKDSASNIHVLCERHHDMVHDRERALEDDEDPPPMEE